MPDEPRYVPPPGYGYDAIDEAFVKSLMPDDGSIPIGFVAVVAWIDPDGSRRWRVHTPLDDSLIGGVGLLEVAKAGFIESILHPKNDDD